MAKITNEKVTKNSIFGDIPAEDLPKNEGQIRPLIALENTGEKKVFYNSFILGDSLVLSIHSKIL